LVFTSPRQRRARNPLRPSMAAFVVDATGLPVRNGWVGSVESEGRVACLRPGSAMRPADEARGDRR